MEFRNLISHLVMRDNWMRKLMTNSIHAKITKQ